MTPSCGFIIPTPAVKSVTVHLNDRLFVLEPQVGEHDPAIDPQSLVCLPAADPVMSKQAVQLMLNYGPGLIEKLSENSPDNCCRSFSHNPGASLTQVVRGDETCT